MFPCIELHVIDKAEQSPSGETEVLLTGITGSDHESIDIPTEILQDINSTGICIHVCALLKPNITSANNAYQCEC